MNWRRITPVVAGMAVSGCGGPPAPPPQPPTPLQAVECPKEWPVELSGPGTIQNIPEFHDCQRFLVVNSSGTREFGAVYAVFAILDPDYTPETGKGKFHSFDQNPASQDSAVVAAQIWAGAPYAPLHLGFGYNCLYVYRRPGGGGQPWKGRMVNKGPDPGGCRTTVLKEALLAATGGDDEANDLAVIRSPTPNGTPHDLPQPSARWHWHDDLKFQYVGLTCGDWWCEVGPKSLKPLPPHAEGKGSSGDAKDNGPHNASIVVKVKGWYDRQFLAKQGSASQGLPSPTGILGTIIPAEGLGDLNAESDFTDKWVEAAYVSLIHGTNEANPYRDKLHLTKAGALEYNVISLCRDGSTGCLPSNQSAPACKDGWRARIERAEDGKMLYTCVKRCDMPNERIPATVRWRWLREDETMWIRCALGCCEVILPGS